MNSSTTIKRRARRIASDNIIAFRGSVEAAIDRAEARTDLLRLYAILRRRTDSTREGSAVMIGFLTDVEAAECLRLIASIRKRRA